MEEAAGVAAAVLMLLGSRLLWDLNSVSASVAVADRVGGGGVLVSNRCSLANIYSIGMVRSEKRVYYH